MNRKNSVEIIDNTNKTTSDVPGMPSRHDPLMETGNNLVCYNIKDFLELKIPPAEYILHPILCERRHAMIYAPRGAGKTWFCLSLAYSAATGITIIERYQAKKACKVLYIDGEMAADELQSRLLTISGGKIPPEVVNNFRIMTPDLCKGQMPNIASPFGQDDFGPFLRDVDVIFIDNISSLSSGINENDAESWGPFKQWLLYVRKLGIAVVIIHHAGKNGQQRGTSSREDSLDVVLSLKPQKSTSIEEITRFNVHFEKARSIVGKDAKPFSLEMSITEAGINWQSKPLSSDAVREKRDQRLDKVLKLAADGNTTRAIADATGIPRSTVQRMLHNSKLAAN